MTRPLRIPDSLLSFLAKREASLDHGFNVHTLSPEQCKVERITYFDCTYSATPDDIGEIEVTYSDNGWRAIYGFTAEGKLTIYAD